LLGSPGPLPRNGSKGRKAKFPRKPKHFGGKLGGKRCQKRSNWSQGRGSEWGVSVQKRLQVEPAPEEGEIANEGEKRKPVGGEKKKKGESRSKNNNGGGKYPPVGFHAPWEGRPRGGAIFHPP